MFSDEANSSQGSNGLYLKCGLIYSLVRQSLMWYGFVSDYSFHWYCAVGSSGVMVRI